MDKYERLLEEKIENAKKELEALKITPRQDGFTISRWIKKTALIEEEKTYLDALITYKNLKAKGESKMEDKCLEALNRISSEFDEVIDIDETGMPCAVGNRLEQNFSEEMGIIRNAINEYSQFKRIEEELGINLIESFKNGIDNFSDGYHTFNDLYNQRLILTATIVNLIPRRCWKTKRHEDGDECFGGGWFLVTIETPEGNYGYHYENKYWDLFKCKELEKAKHWDGYTDKDVGRLLSLTKEALE